MKVFKAVFLLLCFTRCNSDDISNVEFEQYSGYYEIIAFKSDKAVDLNNDSIASNELMNEIDSFGFKDLEIKYNQNYKTKLISFFFPKTSITFQYPSSPEGFVDFLDYGFGTTSEFKNNSFELKDNSYIEYSYIDNVESNKRVTIKSDLGIIDNNHLKLSISKEFYDFIEKEWIMLDIEILYKRQFNNL